MLTAEEIADQIEDRRSERANTLGDVANHCPFGCTKHELDEYGYCQHLMGFTNDNKMIETIKPWKRWDNYQKEWVESGDKFVSGKKRDLKEVRATDLIVNPTKEAVVDGVKVIVSAWVSGRVYREDPSSDGIEPVGILCDECGHSCKNLAGLKLHKRQKHPVEVEAEV